MDHDIDIIMNDSKDLHLTAEERSRVRENLLLYMHEHPAHEGSTPYLTYDRPSYWFAHIYHALLKPIPAILITTLVVGSGTAFAAEQALPGNPLYPIKVNVNEEIRGWVAISHTAKAEWEVRRAERRLEEAEQLGASGKLSVNAKTEAEANFSAHADRVSERLEEMESGPQEDARTAADVNSDFEITLNTHELILRNLGTMRNESKDELNALASTVHMRADVAAKKREKTATRSSVSEQNGNAAQKKLQAVKNKVEAVRAFIDRERQKLDETAVSQAEARLADAHELINEGEAALEAGSFGEAFSLFQQALWTAQESSLLLEANRNFRVDVKVEGRSRKGSKAAEREKSADDAKADAASEDDELLVPPTATPSPVPLVSAQPEPDTDADLEKELRSIGDETQQLEVEGNTNLAL